MLTQWKKIFIYLPKASFNPLCTVLNYVSYSPFYIRLLQKITGKIFTYLTSWVQSDQTDPVWPFLFHSCLLICIDITQLKFDPDKNLAGRLSRWQPLLTVRSSSNTPKPTNSIFSNLTSERRTQMSLASFLNDQSCSKQHGETPFQHGNYKRWLVWKDRIC